MRAAWQAVCFGIAMALLPLDLGLAQEAPTGEGTTVEAALPRFVSLRAAEVRLRSGPGQRYPIEWVYRRRNLPVEIVDQYENWRRIRDFEGTEGWVHSSLLRRDRTLLVIGAERRLRAQPQEGAETVALLEVGVILAAQRCEGDWCRAEVEGHVGWLRRDEVWGVYPTETLQ